MKLNFSTSIKFFSIFLLLLIGMSACAPKKDPYRLRVTVVDEDGIPVQNALVYFSVPIVGNIINDGRDDQGFLITDINGEVLFTHTGKAIVEVVASKAAYRKCDNFLLEMGTQEVTMTIYPWGSPNRTCQE